MAIDVERPDILPSMHPGELVREELMIPLGQAAYAIAEACHVPRTRIERIAREELGIRADTALRRERYFGIDRQRITPLDREAA